MYDYLDRLEASEGVWDALELGAYRPNAFASATIEAQYTGDATVYDLFV
jgi:hypothetical protein